MVCAITEISEFELSHFLLLSSKALKWFLGDHIMSLCAIEGLHLVLVLPDVCLSEDGRRFETLLIYQHAFIASVLATYRQSKEDTQCFLTL